MRKIISLSLGVALTATLFAAVPTMAESAVVSRGGDCGLPGFEGGGLVVAAGTVKKLVRNDNHWIMTCKGTGIPNDLGRTEKLSGFGCAVMLPEGGWIMTSDSHVTIAKNGNATMKCKATFDEE